MRRLNLLALMNMDGQDVIVHDLAYDAYDQLCKVKVEKEIFFDNSKKKKPKTFVKRIVLFNEEFTFILENGKCVNGDFSVFTSR